MIALQPAHALFKVFLLLLESSCSFLREVGEFRVVIGDDLVMPLKYLLFGLGQQCHFFLLILGLRNHFFLQSPQLFLVGVNQLFQLPFKPFLLQLKLLFVTLLLRLRLLIERRLVGLD